jgi:hypothetical protein
MPDLMKLSLYQRAFRVICKCAKEKGISKHNILDFSDMTLVLNYELHLKRCESLDVLDELAGAGVLVVVPYRGVRIIKDAL